MTDPEEDVLQIGFLPLCHIFEVMCHALSIGAPLKLSSQKMVELLVIACGGTVGYSTEPLRLLEDLQILKPNLLPCVPRVLNRIYQSGMAAAVKPGMKGALFRYALQVKLKNLHATGETNHALWDRLIFSSVM